jgi:acyl-CoA thioesterase FadM
MTARLDVSYHGPTPLYREAHFEGQLEKVEGRKIFASATMHVDGRLCAKADGLFVSVDFVEMHNRVLGAQGGDPPPESGRKRDSGAAL